MTISVMKHHYNSFVTRKRIDIPAVLVRQEVGLRESTEFVKGLASHLLMGIVQCTHEANALNKNRLFNNISDSMGERWARRNTRTPKKNSLRKLPNPLKLAESKK